jgi:hypothetical protein
MLRLVARSCVCVVATLAFCVSAPATAASVQIVMGTANVPLPPGFDRYGLLTLTETGPGSVLFSARVGGGPSPGNVLYGFTELRFNLIEPPVLQPSQISTPNYLFSGNTNYGGFGAFTFEVTPSASGQPAGQLQFTISRPGLSLSDIAFNNPSGWGAAMRIVGFSGPPGTSPPSFDGIFAGPAPVVPLPAPLVLLISGLAAIGVAGRYRPGRTTSP